MQKVLLKSKLKAMSVHFLVSLIVFSAITIWLLWIIYPSFFLKMAGGTKGLYLMFLVDVVLGPLITFIVFDPKKTFRHLLSDFIIIGLIQLSALVYGMYTVYQERPSLVVLYEYGNAVTLTHRQVASIPQYSLALESDHAVLESVPFVMFYPDAGDNPYLNPLNTPDFLKSADKGAREEIKKNKLLDDSEIEKLEKQYGRIWVIAILGKYNVVYIALDEKLKYIDTLLEF